MHSTSVSVIERKYFLDDLIEACNQAIQEFTGRDEGVRRRQIYEDIRFMKSDQGFSAPIENFRAGEKTVLTTSILITHGLMG